MSDVRILALREFLKIGAGANLHTVKFEIPLNHESVFISEGILCMKKGLFKKSW